MKTADHLLFLPEDFAELIAHLPGPKKRSVVDKIMQLASTAANNKVKAWLDQAPTIAYALGEETRTDYTFENQAKIVRILHPKRGIKVCKRGSNNRPSIQIMHLEGMVKEEGASS